MTAAINILPANADDLEAINQVIAAALMTWNLPERVKRLSLPVYYYDEMDLQHMRILVASITDRIVGVMALEHEQIAEDIPDKSMLIHGLFVQPEQQHKGIGTRLFLQAEHMAQQQSAHGLLVKAHKDASGFFSAMGMIKLAVSNEVRDYADRYWKTIS